MRQSFIISLLLSILIGLPSPARGEEILTIDEALRLAHEAGPSMVRSRFETEVAKAGLSKAKAYPNPRVETGMGPFINRGGENPRTLSFEGKLSQELELWGKRGLRKLIASKGIEAAGAEEKIAWLDTAFIIKGFYSEILRLQGLVDTLKGNVEIAQKLLGKVEQDFREQKLPFSKVLRARVETAEVKKDFLSGQNSLASQRRQLNLLLGRPLDWPFAVSEKGFGLKALEGVSSLSKLLLTDAALGNRPELAALKARLDGKENEIRLAKREWIPNLDIGADVERSAPGEDAIRGTIGLTIPLWYRNKGEIQRARAESKRTRYDLDLKRTEIEQEVWQALANFRVAKESLDLSRASLTAGSELLRVTWTDFEMGTITFIEALDNIRSYARVKTDYLQNLADLRVKQAAVERTTAADIEEDR